MRRFLFLACLIWLLAARASVAVTFSDVHDLYQSVDQLSTWSSTFAADNPDLVRVFEFGRSSQDRPLLAIEITENPGVPNAGKPQFLFTAGLHAREVIGSQAAFQLAVDLVGRYRAGDPLALGALGQRDVWIVPDLNPDGRVRVESGYSMQRKNMELFSGQNPDDYTRGVDLNRNFPHHWSFSTAAVTDETYQGPAVLSAPEASALWTLVHQQDKFSNLLAAIDFHSGAATILAPWVSPRDNYYYLLPAADRAKFDSLVNSLSQLTGLSNKRLGYNSYGSLTDSLYEDLHTYSLAEEIYQEYSDDTFTMFNPLDQPGIDAAVGKAVASAEFLLSDEAFDIPEPATVVLLLTLAAVGLICGIRSQRRTANP